MKRFGQFVSVLGMLFLVCAFSRPVGAQKGGHKAPPPPPPANDKPNNSNSKDTNKENNNEGSLHQLTGLPPKFIENLREMSPEQQERFLSNNERFQNMSPQQQARIRQNLKDWNSRTPE